MAIPFDDRERKEALSQRFGVSGIPTLVILDEKLNVITTDGRSSVGADPEGADFPWLPKPLNDLSGAYGAINDTTSIVVFSPTSDILAALETTAQSYWDKAKETDSEPEFAFFTAKDPNGDIAQRVMGLTKMEASIEPQLLLLDIPDDGAFYTWDKPVTADSVVQFLNDYKDDNVTMTRKQLS